MKKRIEAETLKNYSVELNQERAFWENQLNQKINFFLLFFALIVAGVAFSKSKEFTLTVLLVGAIILLFLSLMIINATRKINIVIKELMKDEQYPVSLIDSRSRGRLFRIIVGYGLPIFCAVVVTLAFISGISGIYSFGFPTKEEVVQTVKEAVDNIKEKITNPQKVDSTSKYFQNIESAIDQGKSQQVSIDSLPATVHNTRPAATPIEKGIGNTSNNFQGVDKVILNENAQTVITVPLPSTASEAKPEKTPAQKEVENTSKYFQSIDKIITTEKTQRKTADTINRSKQINRPAKTSTKK